MKLRCVKTPPGTFLLLDTYGSRLYSEVHIFALCKKQIQLVFLIPAMED